MRKVILLLLSILFVLVVGILWAQEDMEEEPAYISFISGNVDVDVTPVNDIDDFEPAELDMELPIGTTIRTGQDAIVEITMPDESIVRLSSGTVFQIEDSSINRDTGRIRERFNLIAGKIKATVQKFTTSGSEFTVASGTALAGVRGTILGGSAMPGQGADFLCFVGKIVIESVTGAFEPIVLYEGQMSFVPIEGVPEPVIDIPDEVYEEWEQEFKKFEEAAPEVKEEAEEEEVEKVEEVEEVKEEIEKPKVVEKKESALQKILKLNAYVGTVTIDNNVYAHWVFTPEFTIGKLGIGLYLPAIFAPNVGILGFNDWYNHDEWDYTSLHDAIHDTLLKFYYIRWGIKGDPFYLKVGSIDDFSLGHGFIVDNYSNMIHFPKERSLGMQLNVDTDIFGFESMVADFSRLQLFGGRLYLRPMGRALPLAVGISAVRDRPEPYASSWPAGTTGINQLPNIFVFGVDAELPIINLDTFALKLYADGAKVAYSYPEVPAGVSVTALTLNFIDGLGTAVGLMGHIAKVFNYRAEYRFIMGYYEPGFINSMWENRRLYYQQELRGLIIETAYRDDISTGLLIRGGLVLFEKLEFGLGYEDYNTTRYSIEAGGNVADTVRKADVYLGIKEGLIPKVYGSLSYDRNDNLESVFQQPFDDSTMLEALVVYEIAPGFAFSVNAKRTFQYNDVTRGYDPVDSFGIRTIFSF